MIDLAYLLYDRDYPEVINDARTILYDYKRDFTFEPEKRKQIKRTQRRLKHKLVMGPQVTQDEKQFVLSEYDFGVLLFASTEYCKTCMGTPGECRKCQLGKVLDSTSFISRGDDRSWWEVMENVTHEREGEFE